MYPVVKSLSAIAVLLALGACSSLQPQPLTAAEITTTTQADRLALYKDVLAVTAPLTLEQATARAIKYNADRRMRRMEEVVAFGGLDVANYAMLPQLVASAGYRDRSNDLLTLSRDVKTNTTIGGQTISSERESVSADLSFSWSLLDFGQSYYAAKQSADRYLIATERSRRALQILLQDVRTAFWRVAAAQKLDAELKSTTQAAESALVDSRKVEAEGLRPPLEPLRYQRALVDNLRLLEQIEQELSTARIALSQLIGAPPGQKIEVIEPPAALSHAWMDQSSEKLEEYALAQNGELRESMYDARIARLETRKAMLRMFPGLSFNYAVRHDNDRYLINQSWNQTGLQLSFNLLGMLSAVSQSKLADAGVMLADQRRMTTQMAVISQLHLARLQYGNAIRQYERADQIDQLDQRIAQHAVNAQAANRQTALETVAQQTSAILSRLRRYQALSTAEAAASKLQATLGLTPPLSTPDSMSLEALTAAVGAAMKSWDQGMLPAPEAAPAAPAPEAKAAMPAPAIAADTPVDAKATS